MTADHIERLIVTLIDNANADGRANMPCMSEQTEKARNDLLAALGAWQGEAVAFRYKAPIFGSKELYWSKWIDLADHPQDLSHAKTQSWEIQYAYTHPAPRTTGADEGKDCD